MEAADAGGALVAPWRPQLHPRTQLTAVMDGYYFISLQSLVHSFRLYIFAWCQTRKHRCHWERLYMVSGYCNTHFLLATVPFCQLSLRLCTEPMSRQRHRVLGHQNRSTNLQCCSYAAVPDALLVWCWSTRRTVFPRPGPMHRPRPFPTASRAACSVLHSSARSWHCAAISATDSASHH